MKFAVDRIENGIAILENIETKEKREVDILSLPVVFEKDILVFEDGMYRKDDKARDDRRNLIREKLERLKRNNK